MRAIILTRRAVLQAAERGAIGAAGLALVACPGAAFGDAADEARELVRRMTGTTAVYSARVRLAMPPAFGNGYTVPLTLDVDSPMTETDHVRLVRVFAPKNPIILVAGLQFSPQSGRARVSTRIRLAEPQHVIAVADMSDGTALMASTWVKVDTNGCA